jgi:hypothetical protein
MLEWRTAMARRRLLAWNIAVPLLLLAPIAFSSAAAPHRAAVYALFFVFFGTFGTCIPLIRDGSSGWIEKQRLTGYGDRRWLLERIAAGAALDMTQLLPTVVLLAVASRAPAADAVPILGGLALGLIASAALGAVVAALVRSLAEGALACAAVALFALHLSGVFRVAVPGTWTWQAQRFGVFRPLAEGARLLAGAAVADPEAGMPGWADPAGAVATLVFIVALAAPKIVTRLGSTPGITR